MGLYLIFLATLSAASAATINLQAGQIHDIIFNTSQPQKVSYKFSVSPNNNLQVYCDDFRLPSSGDPSIDCQYGEVKLVEGNNELKICGRVKMPVIYKSKSSELNIDINYRGGAIVCIVKSCESPKPEEIFLRLREEIFAIDTERENKKPYFEKAWSFTSPPGTRISIQCGISFDKYNDRCYQNIVYINNGNGETEYCGEQDVVLFSQGTHMTVRVQLDRHANRNARCILQPITGPRANEHENISLEEKEEDSSEHGVALGPVSTSCKCGWSNKQSGRIFHGDETKEGEYPWMVGIRDLALYQRCGGSIITPYHVLTAAHCMYNSKVRDITKVYETIVSVGTMDRFNDAPHGETQYIKVIKTFIPDEYTKFQKNYDISVLYLEKAIRFSKWVGPVCMPSNAINLVYKKIRITGWGLDHTGKSPQYLMTTKLRVLPKAICNVPEWIICQSNQNTSTCYGDSGSPFVYLKPETNRYTQVSVVSYGQVDCRHNSGSSNVTYHMEFIKDAIERTNPQELCM